MDNSIRITLRLPVSLHNQVVALAQEDDRSLNRQIVRLLQEAEQQRAMAERPHRE